MFRTNDRAEFPCPDLVERRTGDRFWCYIQVMFQHNWFVVSFTERTTGEAVVHTVILSDFTQITGLVSEYGVELNQVVLATPPSVNSTDQWRFEPLTEVWDCDSDYAPNCPIQVYVVASGKEYIDSLVGEKPERLRRMRKVFPPPLSFNRPGAH